MKEITKDTVLAERNKKPLKKCFHGNSGIKKNGAKTTFSVSSIESVKKIFEAETGMSLNYDSKSDEYYMHVKDEQELAVIEEWERKQGSSIFLRDCLSLSVALDFNFKRTDNTSGERTEIGELVYNGKEYNGKYNKDQNAIQNAINQLVDKVSEFIQDKPFYKDADLICSVAPGPDKKGSDLPSRVTNLVSAKVDKQDVTNGFVFNGPKLSVKDCAFEEKWEVWEKAKVSFQNSPDFNVDGKTIILIDDIYQSGITIQYIAMKLQQVGAKEVYGLCFVKTLRDADNKQSMSDLNFDNKNIARKPIRVELDDALYPERVKRIMVSQAPKHLDMVGNTELLNMPGLGFCGSRKSSPKGLEIAQDCAEQVARKNFPRAALSKDLASRSGLDISAVSGNAAGVDFEVHYNCLKAGGKTILVLPQGINYFRIRKALKSVWDWERVLVVSQFEPNEPWRAFRAMIRNQLIIALSRVMIIIEAGEKGGALNAGEETLKYGVPLYVAQYRDMPRGNQMLLDMGALKLAKRKSENRANLAKVFDSMKEDKLLKSLPQQGDLL
ncbi:hypothetical protein RLOatenuis_1400 [Rickettsiales bacterium]|nr:hypothetical protein RLOatenuis_1400 [Rickettsiales bacterium]